MRKPRFILGLVLGLAAPAFAQSRPDEGALFGAPADAGAGFDGGAAASPDAGRESATGNSGDHDEGGMFGAAPPAAPAAAGGATAGSAVAGSAVDGGAVDGDHAGSEGEMFGAQGPVAAQSAEKDSNAVPDNPLTLGGLLYMRSEVSAGQDTPPKDWATSMPNLMDVYLDARPNDNVRAYFRGRILWDPTQPPSGTSLLPTTTVTNQVPNTGSLIPNEAANQPQPFIDQMWINFNVEHDVFVTAGRQHVKWGTGHFWNPTDFLEPQKLNPLLLVDPRLGTTMVKAQVPWEKYGGSLYAIAMLEPDLPANMVQNIGGAARAEIQILSLALGAEAVVQRGKRPHFGADLSRGIGPFDVYAEAALQEGSDQTMYELRNPPDFTQGVAGLFQGYQPTGPSPQVVGGLSWETNVSDNDALTLGAEYFYNSLGYTDVRLYPWLLYTGQFTPFYVGKNYVGAYGSLTIPGSDSFTTNNFLVSTVGNLSDKSFISRVDYFVTVLIHLQVEVFADVHYGSTGEFDFGLNLPALPLGNGQYSSPISSPAPSFDVGLGLRLSL